jgi:hypothetical protein
MARGNGWSGSRGAVCPQPRVALGPASCPRAVPERLVRCSKVTFLSPACKRESQALCLGLFALPLGKR